jgi:hypothetical protein
MRARTVLSLAGLLMIGLAAGVERLTAQAELPMAKAESVGMSSKRLERINQFIQGYMDRG